MALWCRRALNLHLLSLCRGSQIGIITRNYSIKKESKPWQQKPNRKPRLSIVLTEDVKSLGAKGQIVKVKHGYGRNQLIPQKKAVYATPGNIKKYDAFEIEKGSKLNSSDDSADLVDYLNGKVLYIRHEDASAIFEQQISKAFHYSLQLHVPLDCIELEEPITDFEGKHSVGVRVDDKTVVTVPLEIERTLTKKKQRRVEKMERFQKIMESKGIQIQLY